MNKIIGNVKSPTGKTFPVSVVKGLNDAGMNWAWCYIGIGKSAIVSMADSGNEDLLKATVNQLNANGCVTIHPEYSYIGEHWNTI